MDKGKIEQILEEWNVCSCDNSALADRLLEEFSPEGEYIKKEDLFNKTIKRNSIWNGTTNAEGKGLEEIVNSLPTYHIPEMATSGEYIRKADMERILYSTNNAVRIGEEFLELPTYVVPKTTLSGEYIKKADVLRIVSITTLSIDQVVSTIKALTTYSFPDSAENKGEWIATENEEMEIDGYFCSKCDLPMLTDEKTPFCPFCGADMREPKGLTAEVGIVGKPSLLNQIIPIGEKGET